MPFLEKVLILRGRLGGCPAVRCLRGAGGFRLLLDKIARTLSGAVEVRAHIERTHANRPASAEQTDVCRTDGTPICLAHQLRRFRAGYPAVLCHICIS
jgi:hypothetical protein